MAVTPGASPSGPSFITDPSLSRAYPGAFTASDLQVLLTLPYGLQPVRLLGTLMALSISTHRDKFPVTSLGLGRSEGLCWWTSYNRRHFNFQYPGPGGLRGGHGDGQRYQRASGKTFKGPVQSRQLAPL